MPALSRAGVATGLVHCHPLLSASFGYAEGVGLWRDLEPEMGGLLRRRAKKRMGLRQTAQNLQGRMQRLKGWERLWKPLGRRAYRLVDWLMMRFYYYSWDQPAYLRADEMTDQAAQALREMQADAPRFLWVHYIEPHGPFFPPPDCVEDENVTEEVRQYVNRNYEKWVANRTLDLDKVPVEAMSSLYDAEIRFVDREIARLFECLRDSGAWDTCAVAVTADHGEEFGEHGSMFHHLKLYRELLHVPLILRVPGAEPRRVERAVSTVDFCPTAAEALGAEPDPGWKGRSLLRFGDGTGQGKEELPVISECRREGRPLISVVGKEFRLLYNAEGAWEAYRRSDLLERRDVHGSEHDHPELVRLRGIIEQRLQQVEETGEDRPTVDDEKVKKRLEALGYFE
jgi:arylsulfatase A-like enzyme